MPKLWQIISHSSLGFGNRMTISLPGRPKKGLSGLLGRKKEKDVIKPAAQKQLGPQQLAKLFDKEARALKAVKPAKLNATEQKDRAQLSTLRGALYSDD
ncbi:MAG: hypothetical protein NWQ23_10760 [Yoonia sp.]|uniref:hypothetical protein n=1 Tax=Yoonia sp. TaxID=2212373 RepID=UPI00273E0329|nr:hypothetical protein [Yoonia sp.]MDP5085891.1 hypothetical protein [Yoonia sp.]MDP5359561.1 hypothetical protein [Paracoccaceae bacterium]MDP5360946.1 hypothetical protein [Paracoccaceae bacterium]